MKLNSIYINNKKEKEINKILKRRIKKYNENDECNSNRV